MHPRAIDRYMLDTNKVKGFLMSPVETFRASRGDSLGAAFRYYVILLVIWTILSAIVFVTLSVWSFQDALYRIASTGILGQALAKSLYDFIGFVATLDIFMMYAFFLLSIWGVFFVAYFWHISALFFGAKNPFGQTIKTTMYASTPFFLLGWIPIIAIIGWIWYLVLLILGLSETQEMSVEKALAAVIVPIILVFILVYLGGAVISSFMAGVLGMLS